MPPREATRACWRSVSITRKEANKNKNKQNLPGFGNILIILLLRNFYFSPSEIPVNQTDPAGNTALHWAARYVLAPWVSWGHHWPSMVISITDLWLMAGLARWTVCYCSSQWVRSVSTRPTSWATPRLSWPPTTAVVNVLTLSFRYFTYLEQEQRQMPNRFGWGFRPFSIHGWILNFIWRLELTQTK